MKKAFFFLLLMLATLGAQARTYNQGELDAILAPVALYPDPLLTHVLNAAAFPDDVAAAAAWRRDNPHHSADQALRDVEGYAWHPSVKALVAQPELLQRLAESPQWLADLGEAFLNQPQEVHGTVQQLRLRAQQNGSLKTDENQYVYQQGQTILVQPAWPNVVYAPYYNPYVVYGGWWWPAYRPVFFRPFVPCAVRVAHYYPVAPLRPWPLAHAWSGRNGSWQNRSGNNWSGSGHTWTGHTWTGNTGARPTGQQMPQPVQQATPFRAPRSSSGTPQFSQQNPQVARPRSMPPPTLQATPYRAVPESRRAPVVQSNSYFRNSGNAAAPFRNGGNSVHSGGNYGRGNGGGGRRS